MEAYVVSGIHPKTGLPAKDHEDAYDIYIQRDSSGHVNTYIKCGKKKALKGVGTCYLRFGLEPEAKVSVEIGFRPSLLPKWKEIQQATRSLLLGFEVK